MFSNLVIRQSNAIASFVSCAVAGGLTDSEAHHVLNYYLKRRLVKLGANDGQFHIKSGNLMEIDTLREALNLSLR